MTPRQLAEFKAIRTFKFRGLTWKLKVLKRDPDKAAWAYCNHLSREIELYTDGMDVHNACRALLHELMHMTLLTHQSIALALNDIALDKVLKKEWTPVIEEYFVDLASWGLCEVLWCNPKLKKLLFKYIRVDPKNPVFGVSRKTQKKGENDDSIKQRKPKPTKRRRKSSHQ